MTTRPIALCASLLALWIAPASGGDKARARGCFEEGLAAYRRGDFAQSLKLLGTSLSENGSFLPAYAARAQTRHALGDDVGAETDATRALAISRPSDAEDWTSRGNARLLTGNLQGAFSDYDAAIKVEPDAADAYLGRGRAWRASGQPKKAIADCTRALRLDPSFLVARFNRALALHESGREDKTLEELTRILQQNPRFHLPYALLGVIFARKGDGDRALKAYSKAILLHQDYAFAYLGRAAIYLGMGESKAAFRDFEEALRSAPDDYAPFFNRGEASFRAGNRDAGLADFRRMLETRLDYAPAALTAGDRLLENHLPHEAVNMFSMAVRAAGASPSRDASGWLQSAYLKRASAFLAVRDDVKASRDLNDAVRISSTSPAALTARAQFFIRSGNDPAKAEEDLVEALRLDPGFAPALVARGSLRARLGRPEEAIKDFTAAIESDPSNAEAYNNRGALYANVLRNYDRAIDDIVKAVGLSPSSPSFWVNLSAARIQRRDFWNGLSAAERALKLGADPVQTSVLRAQARFALGQRIQAESIIEEALLKHPRSSVLKTVQGNFLLRSRLLPKAIDVLDQALSLDDKNARALLYRGLAQGGLGEYRKALGDFEASADLDGVLPDARVYACQAERLLGRAKDAIRTCSKVLDSDPQNAQALVNRGLAFLAAKDYPLASSDLSDANRLGIPSAAAALARSVAQAALRQYKESDASYREALTIDYQARAAEVNFGETPGAKRDFTALIDAIGASLEKDSDAAAMYLAKGNALANAGRFDRAILMYTRATELDAEIPNAYLDRGMSLIEQQSFDAAESDIRRAIELDPKDPSGHAALLTLMTARKRFSEGLKVSAEAVRLHPQSAEIFLKAGNIRYFLGDFSRAQENYELALRNGRNNSAAFNGIGLSQFSRKEYEAALESFSRAIALSPDCDRFYRNRASTFVNMGDFANASRDYRMALDVNTDPEMVEEYRKLQQSAQARIQQQNPEAK
jgi:tetratricopeptide (TPR) repeat protein